MKPKIRVYRITRSSLILEIVFSFVVGESSYVAVSWQQDTDRKLVAVAATALEDVTIVDPLIRRLVHFGHRRQPGAYQSTVPAAS